MTIPHSYKIKNNVLVAIPVYNESRYIESILTAVSNYNYSILVINDGSDDGTDKLLEKQISINVITHKNNEGYGQSLIDAFEFAKCNNYTWIITMDCDYQHQPSSIPNFYEQIDRNNADIISGSRYLHSPENTKVPADRLRINHCITALLNSALKINITDAFCGFKAYRVSALERLKLSEKGYAMPLQLWIQAAYQNLKIIEIPVPIIYHDPKRNFAGMLEIPEYRIKYYMNVIENELAKYDCKDTQKILCS